MIPTAWVLLDALPTTPSGKTDRKALPAPGPEQLGVAARYVAPRTPMEELVAGVFATATGAEKVGAEDRFFDIGGDSIRAIRAVGVLREAGLDVTVAQIFTHPRVADLAELLQDAPRREAERTVERFSLLAEEDRRRLPEGLVDAYPLSVVQAGMVYEMLADPERSLYQNVTCYRMRDDREFSLEAMRAAIALLVERHEILRTSIDLTGYSEPLQLVAANATAEVGYTDLRGVPAQRQEEIVNEFVAVSRRTPIDVTRAPLLRYHVHQTADHEWRLTHIECHAILDGWSHTSVIAEINTAYRALRGGEIPDLPPPPAVRYADFVNLELRSLRSAEDRAFWEERVRWYDRLALPPDSAEAGEPFEVVVSWRELEPQLRALAAATGTSMKSVLFTAHLKLLGMISGQRRFFASTVANGRVEHRDGDRVYGMHLNTLPFAVDLGAASWRELIGAVFAEETALWPHRRYPLPVMQRNWGGGTPLIDVIFGYLDFHVLDRHRDEVRMTVDYSPNEFTLDVWTFPGQLRMTCRPGWTTRERLEYFAQVFLELLAAMVADPEGDPRRFRPTAADPYALVGPHGAPLPEPDGCLHEVFERQVRQTPDAVAVVVGDEKFTYAECNARANRLAHHLRSLGAGPERTVGICLDRGVDQIVAVLAALKTGGAYVPIDPTIPVDRMAYLIRDAEIVALVTEEAVVGSVPPGTPNVVVVEEIADRLRKLPADDPGIPVHPDNLAYVIYTSGSTGMPKGVMATHGGVRRMFTSTDAQLNFRPGQVWSMFHSYIFDFSVWELWGALLHGGRLVVVPFEVARTPQAFYELLVAEGVTVLNQTPSALRALIDAARAADGAHAGARLRVEKLLVGAEVLNPDMVEEIFDVLRPGRVYHVYGTTEDTMFSTIGPLSRTVDGLPSIGRVVPGSSAYVLDENLEPVLPGAVGEICFGGEKIARGYLARPELTAERFVPDPFGSRPGGRMYRTGDLVRQGPEGELYFLGRRDHQVKLRGYRIELGEIEAALATHPAVAEAVVVVRGADADAHLVAYTTTVPGAAVSAAELRAHLVGLLPGHMVPVHYVAMTAFPRTPSDKLDRRALPEPDYSRAALDQAYTEPRTPQERALAAAFCEVLRLDRIGADDDFFELGGHSLAIMRMIALLRERYGWQLTLRTFVEHRTVARLANVVENTGAVPALVWLRREGSLPPLFCVHPGGGSAHWYLRLLPHLDPEQPLAAFEWPGPHDPAAEEPTTEVMAERYLAELRAAQPHGPYRLFGWCGGSGITTEMAHRLRDAGEEVTFVLLDPGLDSHAREHLRNELRLIRRCQEVLDELDRSGEQADPALREEALALLEHIVDEVGPEGVRLPQRGAGTWSRSVRIWREVMELLMSYRHRPFPGDLDLIVSDELARGEHEVADGQHYEEYLERWRELAGGQVRVHRTAGDHFGVMRAPLVGQLATRIQEAIAVSTARG
jgi:amino acid adenylation domain-containing protein